RHRIADSVELRPVRLANKARTKPGFVGSPGARHAAAKNGWPEHRSFQSRLAVDVSAGHAGDFTGRVQARNRFKIPIQHTAVKIGLDPAKVFPRQQKYLNGIVGWRVELFGSFQ